MNRNRDSRGRYINRVVLNFGNTGTSSHQNKKTSPPQTNNKLVGNITLTRRLLEEEIVVSHIKTPIDKELQPTK